MEILPSSLHPFRINHNGNNNSNTKIINIKKFEPSEIIFHKEVEQREEMLERKKGNNNF